ncbi:hypothetical protein L2X99_14470 [Microbacterium sp. KUDC0406]|uniref:hypothetical protein n=1 Tax=Microbacterium sp. KUDC0406 TaxID=2909588 RepID=UPI001F2BEA2D|nr:hypothetical protein [Microbacterium sp. KUDC0406]UJP09608.1 hypothetical protein L2X99_14470 [Microbacterium sp. KUDC0406]
MSGLRPVGIRRHREQEIRPEQDGCRDSILYSHALLSRVTKRRTSDEGIAG